MSTRPDQTPHALFRQGERARQKSRFAEALALYRQARQAAKAAGLEECELDAHLGIGDCLRMQGKFGLAQRAYERASRLAGDLDDTAGKAESLAGIGLSVRAQGNPQRALPYLAEARALYRHAHVHDREGFIVWAMGGTYRFCGDLKKALSHFKQTLSIAEREGDTLGAGYALCGLGGVSRLRGQFAETQEYYAEANEVFEVEDDVYGRAYSYCGLGNAARMRQEFTPALRLFAKAERLYMRIGDTASFAYTVWAMATVFKMQGDHARSRETFGRAQRLFRATRDIRGTVYCRLGTGELAFLQGKYQRAQAAFTRCHDMAQRFGYQAEACHAQAGLALVSESPDWRAVKHAYRHCGLYFTPLPPPLNLP